jgi:hypothetical protein
VLKSDGFFTLQPTFVAMKIKFAIINASLAVVVLFAIVFQSLHSFEHLAKQLTEKKCVHKQSFGFEITHEHESFDHCFICEYAVGNYLTPKSYSFEYQNSIYNTEQKVFYFVPSNSHFSGISYALRGPPQV